MKSRIQNQKGIALIATLMLVVLGFAVVAILLRLATQQTKLARLEQGYTAALDAAKGATDLFIFTVQNGSALGSPPTPPFGATFNQSNCLKVKMSTATSGWSGSRVGRMSTGANTTAPSAISPNPVDKPDMILPMSNNYTVNVKIIDNTLTQAAKPNTRAITAATITQSWHGLYRRIQASMPTLRLCTATDQP